MSIKDSYYYKALGNPRSQAVIFSSAKKVVGSKDINIESAETCKEIAVATMSPQRNRRAEINKKLFLAIGISELQNRSMDQIIEGILKLVNLFEDRFEIEKTEIHTRCDNVLVLKIASEWYDNPTMLALYTTIVRMGSGYTGRNATAMSFHKKITNSKRVPEYRKLREGLSQTCITSVKSAVSQYRSAKDFIELLLTLGKEYKSLMNTDRKEAWRGVSRYERVSEIGPVGLTNQVNLKDLHLFSRGARKRIKGMIGPVADWEGIGMEKIAPKEIKLFKRKKPR